MVTHPDILEAAVVAVKDEKWGERPKAFLTVKEGKTLQGEEVIKWMKANPKISGFVSLPQAFVLLLSPIASHPNSPERTNKRTNEGVGSLTCANRWSRERQKS